MNRREFVCCIACASVAALCGCRTARRHRKKGFGMDIGKTIRPEDLSYCGIDCSACDVFKATVEGDQEARMRAVELWTPTARKHWGMEKLDPNILDCAGCRTTDVQHKGYGRCPIRPCARQRNLSSCGLCREWRTCERLSGVLADSPEARTNLERISKSANQNFV